MDIIKVLLLIGGVGIAAGTGGYFVGTTAVTIECDGPSEAEKAAARAWMTGREYPHRPWIGK